MERVGISSRLTIDCLPKSRAVKGSISADGLDVVGSVQESRSGVMRGREMPHIEVI